MTDSRDSRTKTNSNGSTKSTSGNSTTRRVEPWQERWNRAWAEIGNPPRPKVSQMGSPADVAAREWAALVASGRPLHRSS
jgi:hypothetical protein